MLVEEIHIIIIFNFCLIHNMVSAFILINCECGMEESVMLQLKAINEVKQVQRVSEAHDFLATVEAPMSQLKEIIDLKIRTIEYINAILVLVKIESQELKDSEKILSKDNPHLFEIESANMRIQEKKDKDKAKLILLIHFSTIVLLFSLGVYHDHIWYPFGIISVFLLLVTAIWVIPLYSWESCEKCHARMNSRGNPSWYCWNCSHRTDRPPSGEGM